MQDDSANAGQIEREQLTREVEEELRRQKLRDEIVATLRGNSWTARLAHFSGHPAFIVFVSFALSGLIGGKLTERWQSREWNRQQLQQNRLHLIEDAYAIRDAIIKAIATHNAAIRSVPWALELQPKMSEESRNKLGLNLQEDQREWDAESQVLQHKLHIYAADHPDVVHPDVIIGFDAFIRKRAHTTYPQIEASVYYGVKQVANASQWNEHTYTLLAEESTSLDELISRMTKEIEESYSKVW